MTQKELIDSISKNTELEKTKVTRVLNELAKVIYNNVKYGEDVPLPDIGKLKLVVRPGRKGINPRTKETIRIPEKRTVKLTIAKELHDILNS